MRKIMTVVACVAFVTLSARTFTQGKAESPSTDKNAKGRGLTEVAGIKVGHHTLTERPTGCTAILTPQGTTGGVDVRGGAPGTRETDLLSPVNDVQIVNAISLSGGSAYGLDAAQGVMRYLEEHKIGYPVGPMVVPIVPAAILFDLGFGGDYRERLDPASLESEAGLLYCRVRRGAFRARFGRLAMQQISAFLTETDGELALRLGDEPHPIRPSTPAQR